MNVFWIIILTQWALLSTGEEQNPLYRDLKTQTYFIDKSLFLRDVLTDTNKVLSISAAAHFGKTLNLLMIEEFLAIAVNASHHEIENKNESLNYRTFKDLNIAHDPQIMGNFLGQYPVVVVNFRHFATFKGEVSKLFRERVFLRESLKARLLHYDEVIKNPCFFPTHNLSMAEEERDTIAHEITRFGIYIDSKQMKNKDVFEALAFLSKLLFGYFRKKVYILVDEFDAPITYALQENLNVDAINEYFENFLADVALESPYVEKMVLMGVSNIVHAFATSRLNSVIAPFVFLRNKFSQYFGFTETELSTLFQRYGLSSAIAGKIKNYYNGYLITYQNEYSAVYNPLTIIQYLKSEGNLTKQWTETENSEFILNILRNKDIENDLHTLIGHDTPITFHFTTNVSLKDVKSVGYKVYGFGNVEKVDRSIALSYVFELGYLTAVKVPRRKREMFQIVNTEIREEFVRRMQDFFLRQKAVVREELIALADLVNCLLMHPATTIKRDTHKLEKALTEVVSNIRFRMENRAIHIDKQFYNSVLKMAVTLGIHIGKFGPKNVAYSILSEADIFVVRNNTDVENNHVAVVMELKHNKTLQEAKAKLQYQSTYVEQHLFKYFEQSFLEKLIIKYIAVNIADEEVSKPKVEVGYVVTSIKSEDTDSDKVH